MTVEVLDYGVFSPYLHQNFQVQTEGQCLSIELVEATPLKSQASDSQASNINQLHERSPFSLIFKGPRNVCLPQQIYHLQHEVLGALDIFLVPVGCRDDGMRYEAVFN